MVFVKYCEKVLAKREPENCPIGEKSQPGGDPNGEKGRLGNCPIGEKCQPGRI